MQDQTSTPRVAETRYFTVWRWHFYASLYVVPFLVMLALTGLLMMWSAALWGVQGERQTVDPQGNPLAVSSLQLAAEMALPEGTATAYIEPYAPDRVALFRIATAGGETTVAVNPYTADVLSAAPSDSGLYALGNRIHGTLLLGDTGDRLIEIAASLGILVIATGLWLHWPAAGKWRQALLPRLAGNTRATWKALHGSVGLWMAALALFFLVSGLAWTGIWGGKMVQAWSSFPAEKWDAVPLSGQDHASLNPPATKDVPWGLEETPLPASGSLAGAAGIDGAVTIDTVATFARAQGFNGRFQIAIPQDDTGVWTISHDSMSKDGPDPRGDRTIHIDRYSGHILADIRFADYGPMAKAMAAGVAFHEGDLGLWNLVLNTVFCLSMVFLPLSGLVMWWKRRPQGAWRLAAPPAPRSQGFWWAGAVVAFAIALAFPLGGAAMVGVILLDRTLLRWSPALRRAFA